MDPLSATASIISVLDTVTRLSQAIAGFRHDYALADEDLVVAQRHALLLATEIRGLEVNQSVNISSCQNMGKMERDDDSMPAQGMNQGSFELGIATARDLLCDIEASFPLRAEQHTWASKVRWAVKDKKVLDQLKMRLQSTESTLHGILSTEQLRVSRLIYSGLQRQQAAISRIENGQTRDYGRVDMTSRCESDLDTTRNYSMGMFSVRDASSQRPSYAMNRTLKTEPWMARLDLWGLSMRLASFTSKYKREYRGAVQLSLLDRIFSIQMELSLPGLTVNSIFHSNSVIPANSEMAFACRVGDFNAVQHLLMSGLAHGSDTISSGWPMLDYAIESGSTQLVSLLLDNGARPNETYGDYNMSPLQAAFLRGKYDIARVLLNKGADIEYVDNSGYSVLSYLWVVDSKQKNSLEFMALCQTHQLDEVNACDERGWTALHRAAAIGTADDIDAFVLAGASLQLRADWYGWTPLFFAASHDNEDTFHAIIRHLGPGAYQSLDGDGWSLLHCCVYFGAPNIMKLLLRNGIDIDEKSLPAPLPEDPELSYRELTAADIAAYVGPNRYQMFMNALSEVRSDTGDEVDQDVFWNTKDYMEGSDNLLLEMSGLDAKSGLFYGAEDIDDDRWTLLHWACYNGSSKVRDLLLLKGVDPEHHAAIVLEENPTLFPSSPFASR